MSQEEEKEKEKEKEETESSFDEESTKFWGRLSDEVTSSYRKDLETMMKSDTISYDGIDYKFQFVKGKYIKEFKDLDTKAFEIKDKNSPEWYENVKRRACMIIKDMTPDVFDEGDYTVIENLTTAWSNRAIRGFRRPKQSIPGVV